MATKLHQRHIPDETDDALSALVVHAVGTATETPVEELPPLYDVIDPDALDVLFSGSETDGSVQFGSGESLDDGDFDR
ncbi:HalOD1 output domain-containing protein [Halomicroarcula sp. GCM10025709]|uniref:HalOD1 output domain-containing protein n=1 Tax=Haloarcula TaxID=2237 RepID=UPI0024C381C4|nr:HalOD1 output domain-containing protein [Halomicroarcula sp. YJ-61-S]